VRERGSGRAPASALAGALVVASWVGLTFPSGARAAGEPDLCIVSRHSGEILAGDDFELGLDSAPRRALQLAESVRVEAEAGKGAWQVGGENEVALERDRIVVRRLDRGPRGELAELPGSSRGDAPAEVQVFGLVGSDQVSVLCRGRGARVSGSEIADLAPGWQTLRSALGRGAILCTAGPWLVRVTGGKPRPYAGVFSFRPLPERAPEPGSTPRQARARRGSEVVFRTTLSAYVAGVLAAEHAGLSGEAALALAQVIAHDARVERHPGRPLCDTTHCQVFLGTAPATAAVTEALALSELPTTLWLPYFRGGTEPWETRRSTAEVRAALGELRSFTGDGRTLDVTHPGGIERVPCERVRTALRLEGCPTEGIVEGETVRIRGRGRGHGLGLDVEAARRSGLTAEELLRRAYGLDPPRSSSGR